MCIEIRVKMATDKTSRRHMLTIKSLPLSLVQSECVILTADPGNIFITLQSWLQIAGHYNT
jgi:hypothetical protein